MKKSGKKLLSWLLTPALVLGFTPWISLPADAAAAKEVAVNEASLLERDKPSLLGSATEVSLPDHVKRAKDGTLTYSEDGLGTGNFAEEAIEGGTVYRLYNPNSGEHFYTLSVGERDSVVKAGWNDEGIAYDASVKASDSDAAPVYRVYNPNAPADNSSHHYTCNAAEAQNLVSLGWRFEGVGFYVFQADRKNGMTVYREYNPNDGGHNYTTNKAEHDFLMEAGWADENTAWKVKDVQEVGTQKELEAVLATTSLTDLKIATKKKVELSIPEEDYALVDLTVDAPKASITNAGAFRSIDLRSIAANTWTEKGKNNDIVVNNNRPVHIIVDTLNRLKSLIFNGNIDGVNTLEIPSGTLEQLIVAAQDPIYVSVFGKAEVGSVAIDAATNVNISGKDSAAIGTVDVNAAGADVGITFSDDSTAGNITLSEEASGTEGETASLTLSTKDNAAVGTVEMKAAGATLAVSASGKSTIGEIDVSKEASSTGTTLDIKADDSAKIESVTTSAEDATVSVTSNGQSEVGTVKLEGSAQATIDGDSNNTTTVDITGANKDASVVVKKDSVEVETTPDTNTSSIVTNDSGSSIPTSSKDSNDNETSGSIPPKDGGSEGGSEGGSGGSSGGSSGGGGSYTPSVNVTGVSLDKTNPMVGDTIIATLTPSNATNQAKYDTWKWERSKDGKNWAAIAGAETSSYKLVDADVGNYVRVKAAIGTGEPLVSAASSKILKPSDLKVTSDLNLTLAKGTTSQIKVSKNSSAGATSYASGDTDVATVTDAGLIEAKAAGTTKITVSVAEANNCAAESVEITVKVEDSAVAATGATITGTAKVGETLTATPKPANATNVSYKWWRSKGEGQSVIEGVTGSTYKVTADDAGYQFFVSVIQDGGVKGGSEKTETVPYTITIADYNKDAGTVSVNPTDAAAETNVTVTASPKTGYAVGSVTAKDSSNVDVNVIKGETSNTYTFPMPAKNVTVTVTFLQEDSIAFYNDTTAIAKADTYTQSNPYSEITLADKANLNAKSASNQTAALKFYAWDAGTSAFAETETNASSLVGDTVYKAVASLAKQDGYTKAADAEIIVKFTLAENTLTIYKDGVSKTQDYTTAFKATSEAAPDAGTFTATTVGNLVATATKGTVTIKFGKRTGGAGTGESPYTYAELATEVPTTPGTYKVVISVNSNEFPEYEKISDVTGYITLTAPTDLTSILILADGTFNVDTNTSYTIVTAGGKRTITLTEGSFTDGTSAVIGADDKLVIGDNATLDVSAGLTNGGTIINNGTITKDGGNIINNGSIDNKRTINGLGTLTANLQGNMDAAGLNAVFSTTSLTSPDDYSGCTHLGYALATNLDKTKYYYIVGTNSENSQNNGPFYIAGTSQYAFHDRSEAIVYGDSEKGPNGWKQAMEAGINGIELWVSDKLISDSDCAGKIDFNGSGAYYDENAAVAAGMTRIGKYVFK